MKTGALAISLFVHSHPFAVFQKLGLIVLLHPVVTGNALKASGIRVIVIKTNLRPLDGLEMPTGDTGHLILALIRLFIGGLNLAATGNIGSRNHQDAAITGKRRCPLDRQIDWTTLAVHIIVVGIYLIKKQEPGGHGA